MPGISSSGLALIACYLIGPITRWIPSWAVAGTFVALLLVLEGIPKDLHRILYWGVFFFLGAAFGRLLPRIKELHWSLVLLSGAATAVAIWAHMDGRYSMGSGHPVTLLRVTSRSAVLHHPGKFVTHVSNGTCM